MAKITARIADKTEEWLKSIFENKTAGGEYVLDSFPQVYAQTLHELKGKFTPGELNLILDVMNGTRLTPGLGGWHLLANVEDGIKLNRYDTKWEIDGPVMVQKLGGLARFHLCCLEIWAVGFWKSGTYEAENGLDSWCQLLREDECSGFADSVSGSRSGPSYRERI